MAVSGPWVDELVRKLATQIVCHDEPMPGEWLCGHCPYMNVGACCTKCGASRHEGRAFDGRLSSTTKEGPDAG
jgi:hypothetical protein